VSPLATPKRVTVVAHELRGIRPVGGMGTATTFLALALARAGHDVELLLGRDSPPSLEPYWQEMYERAGVRVRRAPRAECEPWYFLHEHSIALGLREAPPDVVVAHDFGAPAYMALRLRQAGLALEDTLFVVFCHGTRRYLMDVSPDLAPKDLRNLLGVTMHEQAALELADMVVSPSAYLVDWMRAQGWQLPDRTLVIPYLTRPAATGEPVSRRDWSEGEPLERLSFFGRVDEKKGVVRFAAALNALEPELLRGLELEFLGKSTPTWTSERVTSLLDPATERALGKVAFEPELDQHDALTRLSRSGTLAVMPSLQDNSPNAVYECLDHGIPFVASSVGGVPELIAEEDHARVLVEPTTAGLEAALRAILSARTVPQPARAAVSASESIERWSEVMEQRPAPAGPVGDLDAADVVVAELGDVAPVQASSAEFVLLLSEDDVAEPGLTDTLVRAQVRSGADVVTCGVRLVGDETETLHFFTGDAGGLGALSNVYGTVALIRRAFLDGLEGSRQRDGMWPLLARLVATGARIVSVPAPLVRSRTIPGSVERDPAEALLVAQALEGALPERLGTTARLVAGLASPR
jgi:glycosyltransferase involved in cell wall biosynthesis